MPLTPHSIFPGNDTNDAVRFVLDGEVKTVRDIDPTMTILNYVRQELRRTGTKEGCAEGDCGACTVVVAALYGDGVRYRAINSCIQFVPTLDGTALITVESLKAPDGSLHPVQHAMAECHASQCGFCTPGFVMSLFALYKSEPRPSRQRINDALAGNLCRCTGYRPIIDAAERMYQDGTGPRGDDVLFERLRTIQRHDMLAIRGTRQYFAPTNMDDLATLVQHYPDASLLAGGTDVGLWVTKQHRELETVIYLGKVEELTRLEVTDDSVDVGAAVTITDAYDALAQHYADLGELLRRFASPPIRNVATLGGNIANGSPIGDAMPALITLGMTLVLRHGTQSRTLPLDAFYLAYRHTALAPGEFIERLRIPLLPLDRLFRTYKVSKRFDQDISAVCGAYCLTLEGDRVRDIRICYGGMAAIPKRARWCEQALQGQAWTASSVTAAMTRLDQDYTPLTDMRASSAYRRLIAKNLLWKFFLETSGYESQTRVLDYEG